MAQAALLRVKPTDTDPPDQRQFPILSPITGQVLRVFQENATVIQAGARLLELGDPADLEVEVDVLSADAVKIRPGTPPPWSSGAATSRCRPSCGWWNRRDSRRFRRWASRSSG